MMKGKLSYRVKEILSISAYSVFLVRRVIRNSRVFTSHDIVVIEDLRSIYNFNVNTQIFKNTTTNIYNR